MSSTTISRRHFFQGAFAGVTAGGIIINTPEIFVPKIGTQVAVNEVSNYGPIYIYKNFASGAYLYDSQGYRVCIVREIHAPVDGLININAVVL